MQSKTPAKGFYTSCEWLQDITFFSKALMRVMQEAPIVTPHGTLRTVHKPQAS